MYCIICDKPLIAGNTSLLRKCLIYVQIYACCPYAPSYLVCKTCKEKNEERKKLLSSLNEENYKNK